MARQRVSKARDLVHVPVVLQPRRGTANQVGDGPDFSADAQSHHRQGQRGRRRIARGVDRPFVRGAGARARDRTAGWRRRRCALAPTSRRATADAERLDPHGRSDAHHVSSANDARLSMARVASLRANPVRVRHPRLRQPKRVRGSGIASVASRRSAAVPRLPADCWRSRRRGDLATKYLLPVANTLAADARQKRAGSAAADRPVSRYSAAARRLQTLGRQPHALHAVASSPEIRCPGRFPIRCSARAVPPSTTSTHRRPRRRAGRRTRAPRRNRSENLRVHAPGLHARRRAVPFRIRTQDESPACFQVDRPRAGEGQRDDARPVQHHRVLDHGCRPGRDSRSRRHLESVVRRNARAVDGARGFFDPRSGARR